MCIRDRFLFVFVLVILAHAKVLFSCARFPLSDAPLPFASALLLLSCAYPHPLYAVLLPSGVYHLLLSYVSLLLSDASHPLLVSSSLPSFFSHLLPLFFFDPLFVFALLPFAVFLPLLLSF
eukprot:TRINITY_DN0_c5445_g1_i1.p2 TRINITY_DN0_c5445_g1~~TRINITY_DN0_c5445_g1_i1.p2  ORF type:complete len:121 (+),score=35.61 TRINITY_DN0_c5445_g1_i1:3-365(+)